MAHPLDSFFSPASIAVVGASNTLTKIGAAPMSFLLNFGYRGAVIPIHPDAAQVQGRKAWPSLYAAVQGGGRPIDLAIVAVPAALARETLADADRAGVRNLVIFSSGFGETGTQGMQLQRALVAQAQRLGIRMLGPNCLGFMNVGQHTYATFSPVIKAGLATYGPIALVSQSGAFGAYAYSMARERGVGLSHWITTGNEAGLGLADCIEWLVQDPHTQVIMTYIEGVRDGERFKRALGAARAAGKRVVAVKVGRSELGAQAAASHTASLAGDDAAYESLFRQYGVWRAHGIDEFFQVAHALAVSGPPLRSGLGVMTVSGGVGVLLADEAQARGLAMPPLPEAAQQRILEWVPFAGPRNPVDITGMVAAQPALIEQAMRLMLDEGRYGTLLLFIAAAGLAPAGWETLHELAVRLRRDYPHVVLAYCCLITRERQQALQAIGCLSYDEPTYAIRTLAALDYFRAADASVASLPAAPAPIARPELPMTEARALEWLGAHGLPVMRHEIATHATLAAQAARDMGFPVVLKVSSPDILHKSDVGGVALGLANAAEVSQAYERILQSCHGAAPQARIEGVLVAPMVQGGVECMVGVRHDPALGALVVLAIGGVDVELLRDVSVRVAPVDAAQAQAMVNELKLAPLLRGHRARPLADEPALIASLVRLSELGAACAGWMDAIEINPLKVLGRGMGAVALDAVVTARDPDPARE
jgi:acetate---CoA ligase (ADP-forming)